MRLKLALLILLLTALLCGCSDEKPGTIADLAGVEVGKSFRHYGKQLKDSYGDPVTATTADLKEHLFYYPGGDFTIHIKNGSDTPTILAVTEGMPHVPVIKDPYMEPDNPFYDLQQSIQ